MNNMLNKEGSKMKEYEARKGRKTNLCISTFVLCDLYVRYLSFCAILFG